ncbi:RDD family protein [Actinacidiphila glaucinigra]|uniref:RDD family protein n=1 Tax=Actinacidiphila glaucinigra TaxID=235986 RepID=UPI0033AC65B5
MFGQLIGGNDLLPPSPPPSGPGTPAGIWQRQVAAGIDLVIAVLVVLVPLIAFDRILNATVGDGGADVWRLVAVLWLVAFVLTYSPISTCRWGRTLGKRVMGLKVVRLGSDSRIGYGRALIRHVVNVGIGLVPVIIIKNVIAISMDANGQGMHDRLAHSAVVRTR